MKIQTLYKRLSMPLLLTLISATGIGVSSPARSATLAGSQSTIIDAKPEAILIAGYRCQPGDPCEHPGTNRVADPELSPRENLSKDPRYERYRQQQQRELEQQRQQQQRELQQQQRELQQQQPTAEPSPQN